MSACAHTVPHLPRKSHQQCTLSHALAVHIAPRLPRKSGGDPGTPEGRQGVHPTPWQRTLSHACHAKEAETQGRQRDARAYIRALSSAHCPTPATQKRRRPIDARGTPGRTSDPLAAHIVPRLPRKEAEPQGTPGRTSDPLAVHIVPRLPRKRGGDPRTPEGRQGVHPTPWQSTNYRPCHAKEAEIQGRHQGVHPTPWQGTKWRA